MGYAADIKCFKQTSVISLLSLRWLKKDFQ